MSKQKKLLVYTCGRNTRENNRKNKTRLFFFSNKAKLAYNFLVSLKGKTRKIADCLKSKQSTILYDPFAGATFPMRRPTPLLFLNQSLATCKMTIEARRYLIEDCPARRRHRLEFFPFF